MEIIYNNKKLKKICTDASAAERVYGLAMAEKIHGCIDVLMAAERVELLESRRIKGCHKLKGNRRNQYAMHLVEPFRLVFIVTGNLVQIACIKEIVDYH